MEHQIKLLVDAFEFASYKHRLQVRKGEEHQAYITHPAGVCKMLSDAGVTDVEILCGALLHDTVEDTQTTFEELEEKYDHDIEWLDDICVPANKTECAIYDFIRRNRK